MKTRLITTYKTYAPDTLDDFLSAVCGTIEDAFLTNGAEPGKDYNHVDLMTLAMQFATNAKNGSADDLAYTCGWPSGASISRNAALDKSS